MDYFFLEITILDILFSQEGLTKGSKKICLAHAVVNILDTPWEYSYIWCTF